MKKSIIMYHHEVTTVPIRLIGPEKTILGFWTTSYGILVLKKFIKTAIPDTSAWTGQYKAYPNVFTEEMAYDLTEQLIKKYKL